MTEEYQTTCRSVPDAIENLSENTSLNFEFGQWVPQEAPGVWTSNKLGHYRGVLLAIHFQGRQDGKHPRAPARSEEEAARWNACEGSATLVAPGIAITACHVIEDKIPLITSGKMGIFCVGPTANGLQLWRVHKITKLDDTDLMILTLKYWTDLPADNQFYLPCISTRLPVVGETVMISGFKAWPFAEAVQEIVDGVPIFAMRDGRSTFSANIKAVTGRVTQHYLAGRRGIVQGLTIEVDVGTDGGMSGGPVFDRFGNLVGILSASLEHEDGKGPSIVSLIVKALAQPVDACFGKYLSGSIRLIDPQVSPIRIVGRENMTISDDQQSGQTRIEIRGWPTAE